MNPNLYLPDYLKDSSLQEIGFGADGTVYKSPSNNEVTKICVFINWKNDNFFIRSKYLINNLVYIQKQNLSHFVKINNVGKLKHYTKTKSVNGDLDVFVYSYSMEKLNPLSHNERMCFEHLRPKEYWEEQVSQEDFEIAEKFCNFYNIDYNKVYRFLSSICSSKIIHLDVHPRNIMKNDQNEFKLIDLDRNYIQP